MLLAFEGINISSSIDLFSDCEKPDMLPARKNNIKTETNCKIPVLYFNIISI
jgi:hypothetical protein